MGFAVFLVVRIAVLLLHELSTEGSKIGWRPIACLELPKTNTVPLSNVEGVSQLGSFVTLTLKCASEFGDEIRFMTRFDPKSDFLTLGFGQHPVVKELKQLAGIKEY